MPKENENRGALMQCPFCNSPAKWERSFFGSKHRISCTFCGASMSAERVEDALTNWNTRVTLTIYGMEAKA